MITVKWVKDLVMMAHVEKVLGDKGRVVIRKGFDLALIEPWENKGRCHREYDPVLGARLRLAFEAANPVMPMIFVVKMPDGTYRTPDGVHRFTIMELLKILTADVVEIITEDQSLIRRLARSCNGNTGGATSDPERLTLALADLEENGNLGSNVQIAAVAGWYFIKKSLVKSGAVEKLTRKHAISVGTPISVVQKIGSSTWQHVKKIRLWPEVYARLLTLVAHARLSEDQVLNEVAALERCRSEKAKNKRLYRSEILYGLRQPEDASGGKETTDPPPPPSNRGNPATWTPKQKLTGFATLAATFARQVNRIGIGKFGEVAKTDTDRRILAEAVATAERALQPWSGRTRVTVAPCSPEKQEKKAAKKKVGKKRGSKE